MVVLPEKLKKFHRLQAPVWPSSAFKAPIMVQRTFFLWQNPLIVQICSALVFANSMAARERLW